MSTANTIPGLVSVVIPVFNRPAMLVEAVESVLGQSYRPLEIIVVDDGSTDDTPAAVAGLERANPEIVRSIRRSNGGPGAARESGRSVARGEFLQFLDSDDLLLPRKLELQVESLRSRPDAAVSYGPTRVSHSDGRIEVPGRRTGEALEELFPALLLGRLWFTETPLFRASHCEAAGGWSRDLRLEEDWEFEARLAASSAKLVWVPEEISVHRHHHGERAGGGRGLDPERLGHQARAHLRILDQALTNDRCINSREMASFSRALFLLARKCSAAGLGSASTRLLTGSTLAARASGSSAWDVRAYRVVSTVIGARVAGMLGEVVDRARTRATKR